MTLQVSRHVIQPLTNVPSHFPIPYELYIQKRLFFMISDQQGIHTRLPLATKGSLRTSKKKAAIH